MRKVNDGLTNSQRYKLQHGKIKSLGRTESQGRCPTGYALQWLSEAITQQSTACIEWPWAHTSTGYGVIEVAGVRHLAHRFAWMLSGRSIAKDHFVLHHCDNRPCVNLSHLFTGTAKQNTQDMVSKNRNRFHGAHPMAKLTTSQVDDIRSMTGRTFTDIASPVRSESSSRKQDREGDTMAQAVAYLRVSGTTQADESKDGLPRQLAACQTYAATKGLEIVRVYSDEGVSGTKVIENRPALFQLRADLLSNGIKTLVIENMSRLARDVMVSETILADLRKNGITILSTQEPDLCSDEPGRKFIRIILSAVAAYDREMIVSRMKAGRLRAKAQGRAFGGRSRYGMHKNHPGERAVLDRVFHLRRMGMNAAKIAETLNAEKVCTRSGGLWYAMQISRIISGAPKTTQEKQS